MERRGATRQPAAARTRHPPSEQAARIGERFGNPDVVADARHGQGRALIRRGETAVGVALLDEAPQPGLALLRLKTLIEDR